MKSHVAIAFLYLALLQGLVLAQFNLPIFIAESVINEHKNEVSKMDETAQKLNASSDESNPIIEPVGLKHLSAITSNDNSKDSIRRVRREVDHKRTHIGIVKRLKRSPGRQADIDSFLSALESDIAKTQHTRYNSNPVNQQPSWSYKPSGTTERSFWKKFGDSIGSTYTQIKTKTKDIVKGL